MSNQEIATLDERNVFEQYGDETTLSNIVGKLLIFHKSGEFQCGPEKEPVELGTKMAVDMKSLQRGWVRWDDQKPVDYKMGYVVKGFQRAQREDLGFDDEDQWEEMGDQKRDPWQKTDQVIMCDEAGELYTFSTSSKTGRSSLGEVSKAYGAKIRIEADLIPVVELQMRDYKHPQFGKQFVPTFKVVNWIKTPKALLSVGKDEQASAPALAKPTGGTKGKSAPPLPSKKNGKPRVNARF